jgi:hypothetical protein
MNIVTTAERNQHMTSRKAHLPTTGPRARNHRDAARLQRTAQDQLDAVQSGKREAARQPAGSSGSAYEQKAADARRGDWGAGGFDQLHASKRNGAA